MIPSLRSSLSSLSLHCMQSSKVPSKIIRPTSTLRFLSTTPSHLPQNLNLDPVTLRMLTKPPPPPSDDPVLKPIKPTAEEVWGASKCSQLLQKYNVKSSDLLLPSSAPIISPLLSPLKFHPSLPPPSPTLLTPFPSLLTPGPLRLDILHRHFVHQRRLFRGKRTAIVKSYALKSGSGRKPHAQKGTGRARQGNKRRAGSKGGVKTHGPKGIIQDYGNTKINKKLAHKSTRYALGGKVRLEKMKVVESFWGDDLDSEVEGKSKYVTEGFAEIFDDEYLKYVKGENARGGKGRDWELLRGIRNYAVRVLKNH